MRESWPDLEDSERDFLTAHADAIQRAQARLVSCPPVQLIVAARGESLPDEVGKKIAEHVAACVECRMLAEDMEAIEEVGLTAGEKAGIRARLQPAFAAPNISLWGLFRNWSVPAAAVATIAIVAVLGIKFWRARPISQPPASAAVQQSPSIPTLAALPLDKPGVPAPPNSELVWRGGGGGGGGRKTDSYRAQLDAALAPYRKNDYTAASSKLEQLEQKFPQKFEPKFYNGISLLFLNDASTAARKLQAAREVAEPPESYQASWYLAVAEQRAGKSDLALSDLQQLCKIESSYSAKACEAAKIPGSQ